MFGFLMIKSVGLRGLPFSDSLVPCSLCWGFSGGHFVTVHFGVYVKFFVGTFTLWHLIPVWYCLGIWVAWVFFTGFGVSSQVSLSKSKIFNCVFLMHWFLMSNSTCVCVYLCVAVGEVQVWQHCQILWDSACECLCVRECECVWSLRTGAEGWGGSVADMKVKGESCLLMLLLGEPSRSLKSLGASSVFDLTPPLCYTPHYSIEHILSCRQSCNTDPQFTWTRLLTHRPAWGPFTL